MERHKNGRKKCAFCNNHIDDAEYRAHVAKCGLSEEEDEAPPVLKVCALCKKQVKDLAGHYQTCTGGDNTSQDMYEDRRQSSSPSMRHQPTANASNRTSTKKCIVCSKTMPESEYADHASRCVDEATIPKNTRKCVVCSKKIDEDDYADHMETCVPEQSAKPKNTRKCVVCSKMIDERDYVEHVDRCIAKSSAKPKSTRKCAVCSKMVDEDDYADHVDRCFAKQSAKPKKISRKCAVCSNMIDEDDYADHVETCAPKLSAKPKNEKTTQECIICTRQIAGADFRKHVEECLSKSNSGMNSRPAARQTQISCFTCSSPVNASKNSSHTIPCQSRHIYCVKCLQRLMNEFVQSNTAPVCHATLCDYEFSRYDIACLPLDANVIQRLLTCVKNTQRAHCPLCSFYVDFNAMNDLEKHAVSCNSEDMIPCEYCHCLYNKNRLDVHSRECRTTSRSQQQQALVDFLLPRTKYPLSAIQIRVFLEYRKKNRLTLDPHSIVDALAVFNGTFPFDIATRVCDVCMEACVYDDIFVFGCTDSHKLCYGCFEHSCATKMNSNEVLTCGICAYQLQEGEIKQLRVPADRKRQFVDYQIQKTFSVYTGATQGVIRCPNKGCKWVAEARDPNDRFQVTCLICRYQFCSLCNQQYHFRTTCQQIPEMTQRWFFWCNTERGNYWQARAQQDANFKAQLDDYERQRAANAQRNGELQQRYTDLIADENFKAQNCRLCPHCQRVVQHLGGCSSMVCGKNYHGGDQQSGCGRGFDWSQATPYVPLANTGPQQVNNNMPPPEQQKTVVHAGVQCDACHGNVQGIRFDCIHCASLIFCEKCEQRSTLEHSNQNRTQEKQQHVFQLITRAGN